MFQRPGRFQAKHIMPVRAIRCRTVLMVPSGFGSVNCQYSVGHQLHLDEGAVPQPFLEVIEAIKPSEYLLHHPPALSIFLYGPGFCRNVRLSGVLEVEGELGMGLNVSIPAPRAWGACDVEPAIQVVKPDLDTPGQAGLSAPSGDVDGAVPFQGLPYVAINYSVTPRK